MMVWQKNTALDGRSWTFRPVISIARSKWVLLWRKNQTPLLSRDCNVFTWKYGRQFFNRENEYESYRAKYFRPDILRQRVICSQLMVANSFKLRCLRKIRQLEISSTFPSQISCWRRSLAPLCFFQIEVLRFLSWDSPSLTTSQKKIIPPGL